VLVNSQQRFEQLPEPVVFTTQYPLPYLKYMIPTTWRRYQLSQLLNKALNLIAGQPGVGGILSFFYPSSYPSTGKIAYLYYRLIQSMLAGSRSNVDRVYGGL
jgi:hypothetical protein